MVRRSRGVVAVIDIIDCMASVTIRRLDEAVKRKLRMRAAANGRSMEQEAREILKAGVRAKPPYRPNLAESIRSYVAPFGGVELTLPKREPVRKPPRLAK